MKLHENCLKGISALDSIVVEDSPRAASSATRSRPRPKPGTRCWCRGQTTPWCASRSNKGGSWSTDKNFNFLGSDTKEGKLLESSRLVATRRMRRVEIGRLLGFHSWISMCETPFCLSLDLPITRLKLFLVLVQAGPTSLLLCITVVD